MTDSTENFAKYTYVCWEDADDEQREKIQGEHIRRLRRGFEHWNQWAESFSVWLKNNNKTGFISFEDTQIPEGVSFQGIVFPCGVSFRGAKFKYYAQFNNATFNGSLEFTCVEFNHGVRFDNTIFNRRVDFTEAKFGGPTTGFRNAKFQKGGIFNQTEFNSATFFSRAIFNEYSEFNEAKFNSDVTFKNAIFNEDNDFSEAKFNQNANFSNTTFTSVRFNYAEFNKSADFSISKIDILVLENAEFKTRIPDFRYIRLETATYISNMQVPDLGNKKEKSASSLKKWVKQLQLALLKKEKNNENVLLYRKLKELAIQSYDHQKELEFFGYETKAKRGVETRETRKIIIY